MEDTAYALHNSLWFAAIDRIDNLEGSRRNFEYAENCFDKGDYIGAIEMYAMVSEQDANYDEAQKRREEAREAYRKQVLEEAARYAEEGNYGAAIERIGYGLEDLPQDEVLLAQQELYNNLAIEKFGLDAIGAADKLIAQKKYEEAINLMNEAIAALPQGASIHQEMTVFRDTCIKLMQSDAIEQAEAYANQGDYASAITLLENTLAKVGGEELAAVLDMMQGAFVEDVCAKADALGEAGDYQEALVTVQTALKVLPGNTTLQEKQAELMEKSLS